MSQLRKDPFGPAWVIISPERGLEPSDFGSARRAAQTSPLSPGNEALFKELRALRPPGSPFNAPDWRVRIIETPAAHLERKPFTPQGEGLFVSAPSTGFEETVVEHPSATMRLEDMPLDHLTDVLRVYRERMAHLASLDAVEHVQLTRNVGRVAGALFDHPHAQIVAMPVKSRWLVEEIAAARQHFAAQGRCLFCDVLSAEVTTRERVVTQNEHFVALAPYAAKTPFETWILPRQHASSFTALAGNQLSCLADILQSVTHAMNGALNQPPYNMMLHTLPLNGDSEYHWHIELLPRLTRQAGFDWSSGFHINPTPPEDAARFLREALTLQGVAL